jgi:hypothetical protein
LGASFGLGASFSFFGAASFFGANTSELWMNGGGSTSVLDALFDELRRSHDGEVRLKVADGSPVSHDIRISSRVFAVKQLNSSATGTSKAGYLRIGIHDQDEQ